MSNDENRNPIVTWHGAERTPPGNGRRVAVLSSVHIALDNRVFYRQARTLQRAGYDVTLVAVHDQEEVKDGIRILPLPRLPRAQRPLLWRRLYELACNLDADVYQIHDPELLLVTPWIRRQTGKPTIYDIHEAYADFVDVKDYIPAPARRPLARAVALAEPRLAAGESGLIFADDAIAASFAAIDRPKTTLFNFPDRSLVDAADRLPDDVAGRRPTVLYLGGMERNRGTALMMAAFEQVVAQMPEARLLLVGHFAPPDLEQEVRADAERRGIAHAVTMTCRVPFEQIGHYLEQAQVGWVSWQACAKNEKNIPTKLFEYMAYRLPVVSSALSSTRPFVRHGVNGLLVQAGDPADHAAAIVRLLRHPEAAAEMGRAGRRLVLQQFNWQAMEPRLLALYKSVLARAGQG